MELYQQISEMLQKGKARDVKNLVQQAIDAGLPAQEILEKTFSLRRYTFREGEEEKIFFQAK